MIFITLALSVVGAVLAAAIGTLWYSNVTPMGKLHMHYLGFDTLSADEQKKQMEKTKPQMPKVYTAQITLSFLTSFAVVFVVGLSIKNGVPAAMALGFVLMNWLCFMVPMIGQNILWSNCDSKIAWKKFISDAVYNLIMVLAVALLTIIVVGH